MTRKTTIALSVLGLLLALGLLVTLGVRGGGDASDDETIRRPVPAEPRQPPGVGVVATSEAGDPSADPAPPPPDPPDAPNAPNGPNGDQRDP